MNINSKSMKSNWIVMIMSVNALSSKRVVSDSKSEELSRIMSHALNEDVEYAEVVYEAQGNELYDEIEYITSEGDTFIALVDADVETEHSMENIYTSHRSFFQRHNMPLPPSRNEAKILQEEIYPAIAALLPNRDVHKPEDVNELIETSQLAICGISATHISVRAAGTTTTGATVSLEIDVPRSLLTADITMAQVVTEIVFPHIGISTEGAA